MRKTVIGLAAVWTFALLLGAGCSSYTQPTDDSASGEDTSVTTPPTNTTTPQTADSTDFTVSASLSGAMLVKVAWTTPTDLADDSVVRVIYGSEPNPVFGKNYWFQRSEKSMHDAVIPVTKTGVTYFRVCEFKNNACTRYSNEVSVDVKG